MNALDRFWLAPAPAARLAMLRVASGVYATSYLLLRAPVLLDWRGVTAAQWEPVGVMHVLPGPLPMPIVVALWAACVIAGVAFTLGARYRLSGPAFGLLLLWVTSYRNSWGMIFHNDNMAVLHVLALGLCPAAAAAHALDARGAPAPEDHGRFGWPIKLICALTAATYVIAGVAKLRGAGLHWAEGDVLRHYVAYDAVRKQQLGSIHSPLGAWLALYAWPFPLFSALTLLLELGAPLAVVLGGRVAIAWAIGVWGFHVSVLLLMAIAFPYPLTVGLLSFLPAERMWRARPLARLASWLAGAGAATALLLACGSTSPEPTQPPTASSAVPERTTAAAPLEAKPTRPAASAVPTSAASALGIDGRSMPSPSAGDALGWGSLLGERALPGGLHLEPAKEPRFLLVRDDKHRFTGTLELIASEAGDIQGELDEHYLTYAKNFYDLVRNDRASGSYGPEHRVTADQPQIARIGRLRGLRYAFSEWEAATRVQRHVSFGFIQGSYLYVVAASAPAGPDADSSFATLEELDRFEAQLPAMLEALRLPAP